MMDRNENKAVDLKKITITDPFWKTESELVRTEVIPYQWEALNDRIPGAAKSYSMHNFRAAGRLNAYLSEHPDAKPPVFHLKCCRKMWIIRIRIIFTVFSFRILIFINGSKQSLIH